MAPVFASVRTLYFNLRHNAGRSFLYFPPEWVCCSPITRLHLGAQTTSIAEEMTGKGTSPEGTRALRRRSTAVDYREEDAELDTLLGLPAPGSRRSPTKPDIAALRRKVEHACPATPLPATPAADVAATLTAAGFRRPILFCAGARADAVARREEKGKGQGGPGEGGLHQATT